MGLDSGFRRNDKNGGNDKVGGKDEQIAGEADMTPPPYAPERIPGHTPRQGGGEI